MGESLISKRLKILECPAFIRGYLSLSSQFMIEFQLILRTPG